MSLQIKDQSPLWLEAGGEHADIVLSSRVRLARNLKGYLFSSRINRQEEMHILHEVLALLKREKALPSMVKIDLSGLEPYECNYLLEEHLASSDLLNRRKTACVVVGDGNRVSMMINEEDHLRIQSIESGFDLHACWKKTERLENTIGRSL
ncbi:MAG: hypothetical protein U9N45_03705, partial [Gemmatimonadota bacterium]|nr:hypothetical protein [Gemmatimonadota bacterium]